MDDFENNVIIGATANRRKYRDLARELVPHFAEVYIKAPLELCMKREAFRNAVHSPKGIYEKASSQGATVPGINVAYEVPLNPEIVVDAETHDPGENAEIIINKIMDLFPKSNLSEGPLRSKD